MLLVRTVLKDSPIHGVGVFATETISAGTPIWRFDPSFDVEITREVCESLPPVTRDFVEMYAYISKQTGRFVLDGDHARYVNHSNDPNCLTSVERNIGVAARDILPGEEITIDYRDLSAEEFPWIVALS
jgi:uncharacterized protein